MTIVPLDAANGSDVEAWFELTAESHRVEFPADPRPSRRALVGALTHEWPGQRTERWLAQEAGETVGTSTLELPELDNLGSAFVDVLVGVRHRRRGVGRALFDHLVERSVRNDRVRIIGEVREPLPGRSEQWCGAAFSTAMGARRALDEVRRRLDVDSLDEQAITALGVEASAASTGYRSVRWTDRTPERYVADVAYLEGRMSIDPPLGELYLEPEAYDTARVRATEEALLARGRRSYAVGVVHEDTDAMVGYTFCVIDEDVPDHAWQWATIVAPEHRGHRLGMRLKVENLAWLQESAPSVRAIDTWNAEENGPMVAVNEALGFAPVELGSEWQLDLDARPTGPVAEESVALATA